MKKSFALILCLVFVISIALVTCVAFIPMNVTQVASAEVNPILGETYYVLSDLSLSELTYFGAYTSSSTNSTSVGLPMRRYTSISNNTYNTYNYFRSSCSVSNGAYTSVMLSWFYGDPANSRTTYLAYVAGTDATYNHFPADGWYTGNYYYDNSADMKYQTKNALDSSFFDNSDCALYFVNAPTLFYGTNNAYRQNVFHVLEGMLSEMPSNTPILDEEDYISFDFSVLNAGQTALNEPGVDITTDVTLIGYCITNASSHYTIDLNDGMVGVYLRIQAVFEDYDNGLFDQIVKLQQIPLGDSNSIFDDKFYLVLCVPSNCTLIGLQFYEFEGNDYITYFSSSSDVMIDFYDNYQSLFASDTIRNIYNSGYSAGFNAGSEDGNNLAHLIWTVFEMPFKLAFGYYDEDVNSVTYHQYVGGLFNFTILGLDVRPFVLSILSVCILIGIFRIILGVRSGGILK